MYVLTECFSEFERDCQTVWALFKTGLQVCTLNQPVRHIIHKMYFCSGSFKLILGGWTKTHQLAEVGPGLNKPQIFGWVSSIFAIQHLCSFLKTKPSQTKTNPMLYMRWNTFYHSLKSFFPHKRSHSNTRSFGLYWIRYAHRQKG